MRTTLETDSVSSDHPAGTIAKTDPRHPRDTGRDFRRRHASGILITIAAAIGNGSALWGQQPADPNAAPAPTQGPRPVIKVDSAVHDFGTTWIGTALSHSFKITNAGTAPLKILKVDPKCGCTVAGPYPDTLAPGASGEFPFSLDTSSLYNQYEKWIPITSNDPVTPELNLTLRGVCKRYIEVMPPGAYFNTLTPEMPRERTLTIKNNASSPLQLSVTPPSPPGDFKFELVETKPGQEFDLRVSLARRYELGDLPVNLRGGAILKSNIEAQKFVDVRAFARIPGRIDVQPEVITIIKPAGNPGSIKIPLTQVIRISNYGDAPLKVVEATADDPALNVDVVEPKPGKSIHVRVRFDAGYLPPPEGRAVTIKTDDAKRPIIRVPVRRWPPAPVAQPDTRPAIAAARPAQPASRPTTRQRRPAEAMAGKAAPPFSLKLSDGQTFSTDDFDQRTATVLNFVAPTCPHCRKQVPMIERVRAEYEPKNVRFVNISGALGKPVTDETAVKTFESLGSRLELAFDPKNRIGSMYQATSFPTLFVVTPNGTIARVLIGDRPEVETYLRAQLEALVNGRTAPRPAPIR
jgi:thiol-disulfide isomerase/thioredoxin